MDAAQNAHSVKQDLDRETCEYKKDLNHGYAEEDRVPSTDPFHGLYGVRMPYYFLFMAVLTLPLYEWSWRWWISGAPILTSVLLSGKLGRLSTSPLLMAWSLVHVNLVYALFSTSWLFYDFYIAVAYPTAFFLALISSRRVQGLCRKLLRLVVRQFHFFQDNLAFFDFPALLIDDGEVPCLLVIRGITFSFSTMTVEVHGVEVGVQLNEEIDIAIQTDRFAWKIGREISIGDVYGSLKGPFTPKNKQHHETHQNNSQATSNMTDGKKPKTMGSMSYSQAYGELDRAAEARYQQRLQDIHDTNTTHRARKEIGDRFETENEVRAAIGARIQEDTSVPNPPKTKIKSSELVAKVPTWLKKVFEKVPVLLRLFLNPVSYNHPVKFQAIVLTGLGKYINQILETQFFKYYPEENKEIDKLRQQVKEFLTDAKFSVILPDILGLASVPFLTQYDIITFVKAPQVLVYKASEVQGQTKDCAGVDEIAEITGLQATFTIPSCLLPNHEHLLPEVPADINQPDQVEIKMSLLASLPGKFHPEMIDFAITLVKASQILTLHKQATSMSTEVHSISDFSKSVGKASIEQTKKKLVEAHVDDVWLYKLIIKGFSFLRKAKGDLGYQMPIPFDLRELRPRTFVRRQSTMTMTSSSSSP